MVDIVCNNMSVVAAVTTVEGAVVIEQIKNSEWCVVTTTCIMCVTHCRE